MGKRTEKVPGLALDPLGTNWAHDVLPRVLPSTWELIDVLGDGASYRNKRRGLMVICSSAEEQDGFKWLHVSVSRRSRIPTYGDLVIVKRLFVSKHRKALQVFAPEVEHVDIHPNCLHLWCCLDGEPLPDFTRGTGSI